MGCEDTCEAQQGAQAEMRRLVAAVDAVGILLLDTVFEPVAARAAVEALRETRCRVHAALLDVQETADCLVDAAEGGADAPRARKGRCGGL